MNQYRDVWEYKSSLRSRPRKTVDFKQKGHFFPPAKQVLLLLPEVACLGTQMEEKLLLLTLRKYLNDIVDLEVHSIHRACMNIIHEQVIPYSQEARLNAYTIILDEYYHAYNAADLLAQLNDAYAELPKFSSITSDSEHALITIRNKLPEKYQAVFEIIAVSIFETTLIRELVATFQDEALHPCIRAYARDHMNDEARHHHFFYDILSYTWQNMPDEYIEAIGPYLGEFIQLYLNVEHEKAFNFQLLSWAIKDPTKCQILLDELYRGFTVSDEIPIVKNVMRVLKETCLLTDETVQAGFKSAQLQLNCLTHPDALLAE